MNYLKLVIVSVIFVTGFGGDDEQESECPKIILPVIIPAINVTFFDVNEIALNVCDAILTIDSANGN
jgi:hypothetical protein